MKSKLVKFCKSPKTALLKYNTEKEKALVLGSRKLTKELLKIIAITKLAMLNPSKEVDNVTIGDFN